MDLSSFNLHSDQLPIDQELWHQQQQRHQIHTPERTAKPQPVCFEGLQEDLFLDDPSLAVQQWADSSPGSVTTNRNPCELSPHAKTIVQLPLSPVSSDAWYDRGSPAAGKVDQDLEIDHKATLKSMPELKKHDVPYSRLIEAALRLSPDNKLSLQGIYRWFRENTLRGQDKSKGWQNSIRHNLSMNAVCVTFSCPQLFLGLTLLLTRMISS